MAMIESKAELNACYSAIKKLDEAEAILRRAEAVLRDLGLSAMGVHDGIGDLDDSRRLFHIAIHEYLGQSHNLPHIETLSEVLERLRQARKKPPGSHREPTVRAWRNDDIPLPNHTDTKAVHGLTYVPPIEHGLVEYKEGTSSVRLGNFGDKKICAIKVLRAHVHLGLKDAKEFVEAATMDAPSVIRGISSERAVKLTRDLQDNGSYARCHVD